MAEYDVIIRGGTIVDGLRTPRYIGDLAVKDGRIAKIGGLRGATADRELDASGLIVAPGFVDSHTPLRCPNSVGPLLYRLWLAWHYLGDHWKLRIWFRSLSGKCGGPGPVDAVADAQ